MARPLTKSSFVLLALGLWTFACPASQSDDDEFNLLNQQVRQLFEQRRYQEGISLEEKAVKLAKRVYGLESPNTATSLNNLAAMHQDLGEYAKAEPLYQEALRIRQKVLGPEHPDTAISLSNLALFYQAIGETAKAEQLFQEALRIRQKVLGREHPDTAESLNNLASLYWARGEYAKVQPLLEEALRIRQKVLGPEDSDTAISLNNLADLYRAMGEYAKAEPLYQEALRIWQKVLGPEHPDTAISLNHLAELYRTMGQYAKAEPLYQEALRIRQKVLGPEHSDTAISFNDLALLYQEMGEYAKAESLYQEALRITQKVLGPEHRATAQYLSNLGSLYKDMGVYGKAEPLLQEALRIRQKVLGPEHPDTAQSLNNLAVLYQEMDEYGKAEPLFHEAIRIYQKVLGPEHPDMASSLYNLALLYQTVGKYAEAEQLYQQVLQIDQKFFGSEHPDTAISLNHLALLYGAMGEYGKAEPLFQEALRIDQKVLGPEHPDMVTSLNSLAELYQEMGEYAKAEPLFQEALRICQKVLGSEHPYTAQSLNNLAELYQAMGETAKAEPLLQEALRIRQKVLGQENPQTAESLNNLAALYWATGEYAKVQPLFEEALRIWEKVFGPEHPDTADGLNNLAGLYQGMGEYTEAEPLFQEALRIRQKVFGPEHPETAQSLDNLALLEFDLGQLEQALALVRRASATKLTILSGMFSFTSEEQRLVYLDIFRPYSLFPVLKGAEADLAVAVLRYKGVVLDSIVEDRLLAKASQGSEDQKLVEQVNLDKRQLGQLLLQPAQKLSAETNQRIEALEAEVEKIEGQLAQHVAGLGQARHALGVRLEQVQQAIPNDGALIEYLRYGRYLGKDEWEQSYGAIVLLSKGAPLWIPLDKAAKIEALIQRYGALVRGSPEEDELSANLQALSEALWTPIGQALPSQAKKIIISPDGELNFISFATLLSKDKQVLAEKYDFQYVASGRDLLRGIKPSTAKEVVLFANPNFDLTSAPMLANTDNHSAEAGSIRGSERGDIDDWSFESLEGTQKESDELIKKFTDWHWKPNEFTKKKATKDALLKVHSPYILHLATHGFFAKEDPTSTQTESEASLNDRWRVTKSKFFKNPMHRSGLALAGASTTVAAWKRNEVPPIENDGILTAEDVSTLNLQGTWLVTLSACDTGSGEARAGEGVMGLRRGFIQAGAQNLLMTLWPISDEITVQIMRDFYEAAHDSGNAPEALAEVQRKWLMKLRTEKGLVQAVNLAGPFIMSSQGKP
jgi:tetratricopeptide (TPR) repeat protein